MLSASSYIPFDFTVLSDEECFNEDYNLYSVPNAPELPEPCPPSPQPASAPVMRQCAVAHVLPICMPNVFRDIAGRDPFKAVLDFDSRYIPDGFVANDTRLWPGFDMDRDNLKRKAQDISRSESEVYAFLTHNTTSLEEARRLLRIISNVRYFAIILLLFLLFLLFLLIQFFYVVKITT